MDTKEDINKTFQMVFNREPDEKRIRILSKTLGERRLLSVLNYLTINPPYDLQEGKRDNPYGLIYYLGNIKEIDWSNFDVSS